MNLINNSMIITPEPIIGDDPSICVKLIIVIVAMDRSGINY